MQGLPLAIFLASAQYQGAALSGETLYTWGSELAAWRLPALAKRVLLENRNFLPGGCAAGGGLVLHEKGRAIFFDLSSGTERVIEASTQFLSCLEFTLAGRRGILLTHLDAQLRFYAFPDFEGKELYSIYTPSRQGGLLASDVDGDGLEDVFWGNYWLKNPGQLGVAWRLYAVNLWHEAPDSALAALAISGQDLIWAAWNAPVARIAKFRKPADPRDLWIEQRLPALDRPRAVLVSGGEIFIAHQNGVEVISSSGAVRRITAMKPCVGLASHGNRVYAISSSAVAALPPRR